jgi:hypothetical protein
MMRILKRLSLKRASIAAIAAATLGAGLFAAQPASANCWWRHSYYGGYYRQCSYGYGYYRHRYYHPNGYYWRRHHRHYYNGYYGYRY